MIAVIGNPLGRRVGGRIVAAGLPVAIARSAVAAGAAVQLIGKVGNGLDGDAVVLSVAESGVGHAALQRDAGRVTIAEPDDSLAGEEPLDELAGLGDVADPDPLSGSGRADLVPPESPVIEAADASLALGYLPDYHVVVLGQPLDGAATTAVVEAARWAEAHLVVVTRGAVPSVRLPDDATVLEAPDEDAEGAFAWLVGQYAAALDRGAAPGDAFATASGAAGWTAAAVD